MNPTIDGHIAASPALRAPVYRAISSQNGVSADSVSTDDYLCLTQQASCLHTVQRALEPTPPLDSAQIETLRHALINGSYQINPQVIAQRMLELDGQLVR